MLEAVNWWSILIASLANMIIGMLWYGPLLGKPWMKEMGYKEKDMSDSKMWQGMLIGFLGSVAIAYVLAQLLLGLGIVTAINAIGVAFWVWFGFFAVLLMGDVLWGKGTWKLWTINASYRLVALMVMALILQHWI